ncbi:MAG: amidohydrolase [Hyphomicrobiales bacterium]|nr:amidohydrolase [Hyphomicrobiales bacterium]
MRIIDTHLHLIYLDNFSYPWVAGDKVLEQQYTAESYFAEAEKLGIEGAIHMEVDVAEEQMEAETEFMTKVHPKVIGAIASCRPESAEFPDYLERTAQVPGLVGFRRILHTSPNELSHSALFAENIRRLADYDLPFDLCVRADQLPIARALAAKAPDVSFVLDHCGVPDVGAGVFEPWKSYITEIAALPNVTAKVSGIVAYAKPGWTAEDLRPWVEHVIGSFGWDRVVWGSDHPVCRLTADLKSWVAATKTIISGASEDEQSKLLSRNAERVYGL